MARSKGRANGRCVTLTKTIDRCQGSLRRGQGLSARVGQWGRQVFAEPALPADRTGRLAGARTRRATAAWTFRQNDRESRLDAAAGQQETRDGHAASLIRSDHLPRRRMSDASWTVQVQPICTPSDERVSLSSP